MKQPLNWKQIVFGLIIGISTIILIARCDSTPPKTETPQSPRDTQPINDMEKSDSKDFLSTPSNMDLHEKYNSISKKVGAHKNDSIYYKELLKNPDKFRNIMMKIRGKIMNIEENNNKTFIQLYISDNYDSIVIYYSQPINFYKDDLIIIYGAGIGPVQGRLGGKADD